MKTNNFDPIAYIESAFLDTKKGGSAAVESDLELTLPSFSDYLDTPELPQPLDLQEQEDEPEPELILEAEKGRFKKTVMSAPRPRRSKKRSGIPGIDSDLHETWLALPKNVAFLCGFFDDSVTKNYYRGEFKENRQELIRRLLDPELSLEETARLLGVCPATVRRYTNRGWLSHHRTVGGQRRFRLSNIVKFVDQHGRLPEE